MHSPFFTGIGLDAAYSAASPLSAKEIQQRSHASMLSIKMKKKTQLIILSACHSCVVTRKVHHYTTSSPEGLGFLNVRFQYHKKN
jgi:hypothetical protein